MSIARRFTSFTQREIRQIFKEARRVLKDPGLTMLLAPSTMSYGRLLVVIPRAVGNAPMRNLLRRRIKSIFYQRRFFDNRLDCIVIVRTAAATIPFSKLEELITQGFDQSKTFLTQQGTSKAPHD